METNEPKRRSRRQIFHETNPYFSLKKCHRRESVEKSTLYSKIRSFHFVTENLKWSGRDVSNHWPDPVPVHLNLLHLSGAKKFSPRTWGRRLDWQHKLARRLGLPLRRHLRQHTYHCRNHICAARHRLRYHSVLEIKSKEDQFFGSPSARRLIRKQVWDWAISTSFRQIHCHSIHKKRNERETTLLASGRERHHPPNHCLISMGKWHD